MLPRDHQGGLPPAITADLDETAWEQTISLLKRVYAGEGYTSRENADTFMRRETFEAGGTMVIARELDGPVIGAVLHLVPNGALGQVARQGEAEFRVLAVAPEGRGRGIGEALVDASVQRAREEGASAVVIWSQPTMHAAHRLYGRMGFVRAPERDQEDPRGFIRWVFRKEL